MSADADSGSHRLPLACDHRMRPALAPASALALALTLPRLAHAEDDRAVDHKSGATATALAVGGTIGAFALSAVAADRELEPLSWVGLGAAVVAPAAGHLYAGEGKHALVSSGVRAAGLGVFAIGFEMSFCLFCSDDDPDVGERRTGTMLAFAGLATYVGATLYDVIDAHQAAGRSNRRRALALTPAVLPTTDGGRAPGLVLGGAF